MLFPIDPQQGEKGPQLSHGQSLLVEGDKPISQLCLMDVGQFGGAISFARKAPGAILKDEKSLMTLCPLTFQIYLNANLGGSQHKGPSRMHK